MINVDNVTKQFGDFYALKDCTIKIGSGSAYGLLGSNGLRYKLKKLSFTSLR